MGPSPYKLYVFPCDFLQSLISYCPLQILSIGEVCHEACSGEFSNDGSYGL